MPKEELLEYVIANRVLLLGIIRTYTKNENKVSEIVLDAHKEAKRVIKESKTKLVLTANK